MSDNSGPAFPTTGVMGIQAPGLTKREYFACAAMHGLCSKRLDGVEITIAENAGISVSEYISDFSVRIADALLKALEKKGEAISAK